MTILFFSIAIQCASFLFEPFFLNPIFIVDTKYDIFYLLHSIFLEL